MHFGLDEFYPLPDELMQAFNRSGTLIVEVDIVNVDQRKIHKEIIDLSILPNGREVFDYLSDEEEMALRHICKQINIDLKNIKQFKPWFIATQLVGVQLNQSRYDQLKGIDRYFLNLASDKQILELETTQSQLGLFNDVSEEAQTLFLTQTLSEFDKGIEYLDQLAQAWQRGDSETLESLLLDSLRSKKQLKGLYDLLFTSRNISMAELISHYYEDNSDIFVVVGAGHTVGKKGLISLLESQFSVKRVPFIK